MFTSVCSGAKKQTWRIDGEVVQTASGSRCLTLSRTSKGVVMRSCRGGADQRWISDSGGRMKSRAAAGRCLQFDAGSKTAVVRRCSGETSQMWDVSGVEIRPRQGVACVDWSYGNLFLNKKSCRAAPAQRFRSAHVWGALVWVRSCISVGSRVSFAWAMRHLHRYLRESIVHLKSLGSRLAVLG